MAVAVIALISSLTGAAIAAPTAHIVRRISGTSIKAHSISHTRIKANTLGGTEIRESKLGKVPKAKTADAAVAALSAARVGGVTFRKFAFKGAPAASPVVALDFGGLRLTASCTGGGDPKVLVSTTVNDSIVRRTIQVGGTSSTGGDKNFDLGDSISAVGSETSGIGRIVYSQPNGSVVTVDYSFDDSPTYGTQNACTLVGVASQG